MFSGNLSRPALYSLFRLLSVKRRQGLLEISLEGKTLNIVLIEGLIDHVLFTNGAELKYLIETLLRAGLVSNHLAKTVLTNHRSLDASYAYLVGNGHITRDQFVAAKRCYERNLLHALRTQNQAKYTFSPKVIAANEELALNATPGQILLDIIEIEQEEQRFRQYFGVEADPRLSRAVAIPSIRLTREEQQIWEFVAQGTTLKNLFDKVLLSQFDVKKGLLGLYSHRLLKIAGKIFEEKRKAAVARPEGVQTTARFAQEDAEIIKEAAKLLKSVEDKAVAGAEAEPGVPPADVSIKRERTEDHGPAFASRAESEGENKPVIPGAPDASIPAIKFEEKLSLRERLSQWNEWMLEEENRFNTALFVMMMFLFSVALTVPRELNLWFEILGKFSAPGL